MNMGIPEYGCQGWRLFIDSSKRSLKYVLLHNENQYASISIGHSTMWLEHSTDWSLNRRDGVVVRASASQSVDLGFIPLVESYQQTLKDGIYSFPAWRSAFMGGCGEQAGKFACCVLGQGT